MNKLAIHIISLLCFSFIEGSGLSSRNSGIPVAVPLESITTAEAYQLTEKDEMIQNVIANRLSMHSQDSTSDASKTDIVFDIPSCLEGGYKKSIGFRVKSYEPRSFREKLLIKQGLRRGLKF